MKPILLIISFMLIANFARSDDDREFTRKTLQLQFETSAEALDWSVRNLSFDEWLKTASRPEWVELHKSESKEFYFAVFRSGDHLIFCKNDKEDAYSGASISVRSTDDKIAYDVSEKPSMWTTLICEVSYPNGSYTWQDIFTTWKIIDGFSGDIIISYSVKNDETKYRKVLQQSVSWKAKAEPIGI